MRQISKGRHLIEHANWVHIMPDLLLLMHTQLGTQQPFDCNQFMIHTVTFYISTNVCIRIYRLNTLEIYSGKPNL